jgi:hypothetical protein
VFWSHRLYFLAGAACLVLLIAATSWLIRLPKVAPSQQQRAKLAGVKIEGVIGDVGIVRSGNVLPGKPGTELQYGDQLQAEEASTARLILRDGSVLTLAEQCKISLSPEENDTRFHLHYGSLWAAMEKQHQPVMFTTSHTRTSVLGTVLQVSATAKQTRVDVCEGEVMVTAVGNPRQNLSVRAGQYVEATKVMPDVPSQIPLAPDEFHVDLSQHKPAGWLGRWTAAEGLHAVPRHLQHGVLGEVTFFEIMSPFRTGGFFTLHEDAVLEYTARFQKRGFVQVFFGTCDPLGPTTYYNVEVQHPSMRPEPGGWETYRVSLNESLRIRQQLRTGDAFPEGRIAVFILFSTQDQDLGMELGRVSIYRESERDHGEPAASVIHSGGSDVVNK